MALKAGRLLKLNIETLLKARGQTQHELARYCHRTDAWLSKILSDSNGEDREVPLKYLDRIADFFGIATYQLFQPGISPLTERRHADRRIGRDRRISQVVLSERPGDVDVMQVIRALSRTGREQALAELMKILDRELRPPRATAASAGDQRMTSETSATTRAPAPAQRKR